TVGAFDLLAHEFGSRSDPFAAAGASEAHFGGHGQFTRQHGLGFGKTAIGRPQLVEPLHQAPDYLAGWRVDPGLRLAYELEQSVLFRELFEPPSAGITSFQVP